MGFRDRHISSHIHTKFSMEKDISLFDTLYNSDVPSNEYPDIPTFSSFTDILQHYSGFLEGSVDGDLTPGGPLEEETIPILPHLIRMNEKEILTVCSQPGLIKKEEECVLKQRAFVDCFMTPQTLSRLFANGLHHRMDGMVFLITPVKGRDVSPSDNIPVTIEEYENGLYHINPNDPTLYENETTKVVITNIYTEMIIEDLDMLVDPKNKDEIFSQLIHIVFIDLVWGRPTYLFDQIVKCL